MAEDILELLFRIKTDDDNGLAKTEAAIKRISSESGLTGSALANLEKNVRKAFEEMSGSGLGFEQILKRLAVSGDSIGRGVQGAAKQIQKDFKDATDAAANLDRKQKDLQSSASGIKNAISNPLQAISQAATTAASSLGIAGLAIIGITTAATLGAKALFDFVDAQGQSAQQTFNMAQRLGLSAGQMKQLEVEARIAGVSTQSLGMAARYLSQALEDSSGSGKRSAAVLKSLGVSMQTASGQAREEGQVLLETLDALSKVESQTKRTADAVGAFGRGGYKDVQNLVAEYKELNQAARDLGAADTTDLIEKLKSGEEQINKMKTAFDLFLQKLAEKVNPIVIPIVTKITEEASSSHPRLRWWFGGPSSTLDNYPINGKDDERLTPSDIRNHGFQGDAAGLRIWQQISAADLASGKHITDWHEANRKNTPEGRQQRLEEISTRLKAIADSFEKGGLGGVTAQDLRGEERKLESERRSLQDANSNASKRDSLIRELTENARFDKRHPELNGALDSSSQLRKLQAERQRDLDIAGPGNQKLVDAKYGPKIQQAIAKLFEEIAKSAAKAYDEVQKQEAKSGALTKNQEEQFSKQLRDAVAISEAQYEESKKRLQILDASDRQNTRRDESRAVRMAELQGGPYGQQNAIALGTSARINDATSLRNDQTKEIDELIASINQKSDRSVDDAKQLEELTTRRLQIEKEYENEIADARMDAELKIGELRKQQLESYKQEAESFYDAMRKPGGLTEWFRGQANDLLKGIFSNVTAPVFQKIGQTLGGAIPGQTNPDGSKTAVGNMFKGTILDSDRAASAPEIKSRDLNTKAIDHLTAVISGTSAGGQSGSVASGSPADAMSKMIGSGADLSAGSPAQALTILAGNQNAANPNPSPAAAAATPSLSLTGLLGSGAMLGGMIGSLVNEQKFAVPTSESYAAPMYSASSPGGVRVPIAGSTKATGAKSPYLNDILTGTVAGSGLLMSLAKSSGAGSLSNPTGIAGIMSGLTSAGSGSWNQIFSGGAPTWDASTGEEGSGPTYSTSQRVGAGLGDAVIVGGGVLQAIQQFQRGGLRGDLGGVGAATGTAALLDPEPISKSILGAISAGSEILKGILPDPKAIRQAQMQDQIAADQYLAPPTLNRNLNTGGYETYFNKYGQIQSSPYNSVSESQPYTYLSPIQDPNSLTWNYSVQPGQVLEPFQAGAAIPSYAANPLNGSAPPSVSASLMEPYGVAPQTSTSAAQVAAQAGTNITLTINALDTESIFARGGDIASAVQQQVRLGHPVGSQLQQSILGT